MSIYNYQGTSLSSVYDYEGAALNKAYDKTGTEVYSAKDYPVSSNYTASLMFDIPAIMSGTQGIGADSLSNEIAQLYTGKILMIDADTGDYTQVASSFNLLHGGAGQFKPTKEDPSDPYPLLYVSGGHTVNDGEHYYDCLLEVKIGSDKTTLQKVFVVEETTYHGGHFAIDFANNIIYHVFSPKYSPSSGETIDYTYITKWDMTSYEEVTPITLAPKNGYFKYNSLLDSFTIPYVPENQSVTFIDGTIACISDADGNYVDFVDTEEKRVYLRMTDDMPTHEIEGVAFLYNSSTNKYDMVLSARNNSGTDSHCWYYRYQFT